MSSVYNGSGTQVHTSLTLMTGGDRPTAQSVRVPIERMCDSVTALANFAGSEDLDGVTALTTAGGAKTLANALIIDGAELQFSDTVRLLDGAALDVDDGAEIDMLSGSVMHVRGGAEVQLARTQDLQVTGEGATIDLLLTPVGAAHDGDDPVWAFEADNTTLAWMHKVVVSPVQPVTFALPLNAGDVVKSFTARISGGLGAGHSGLPVTQPVVRLIRVDADGEPTVIAAKEGSSSTAGNYDVPHNIASDPDINYTVTASPSNRLYMQVFGEVGIDSVANTTGLLSLTVSITRNSVLGTGQREYV